MTIPATHHAHQHLQNAANVTPWHRPSCRAQAIVSTYETTQAEQTAEIGDLRAALAALQAENLMLQVIVCELVWPLRLSGGQLDAVAASETIGL